MQIPDSWLLFLHGFSAKQNAARVAVWRQLKALGALPLKTSGHVLPDTTDHFERLQWLAQLVRNRGGDCTLLRVQEISGLGAPEIVHLFHELHSEGYATLAGELQEWIKKNAPRKNPAYDELDKLAARYESLHSIDYFDSPASHDVQRLLERARELRSASGDPGRPLNRKRFAGKTWLTRPRPHIDRVGSAWLIRRFIDSEATFVFAEDPADFPDALPFDMVNVEFSHHGDDCTFETLIRRFRIEDAAVAAIGEMVHEADLADGKFARTEGLGLDRIFRGWAFQGLSDDEILKQGAACFDALHAWLSHP